MRIYRSKATGDARAIRKLNILACHDKVILDNVIYKEKQKAVLMRRDSKHGTTTRQVSQGGIHIHVTLSASRLLPGMWTSPEAVTASRCPSVIYTEGMVRRSVPSPSGYGWWEVLEIRAEIAVTYQETQLRGAMPRASAMVQANCPATGQMQGSNIKKKGKCQQ